MITDISPLAFIFLLSPLEKFCLSYRIHRSFDSVAIDVIAIVHPFFPSFKKKLTFDSDDAKQIILSHQLFNWVCSVVRPSTRWKQRKGQISLEGHAVIGGNHRFGTALVHNADCREESKCTERGKRTSGQNRPILLIIGRGNERKYHLSNWVDRMKFSHASSEQVISN